MNRGKWLKEKIDQMGFSIEHISKQLGISRITIWRRLKDENLDSILEIIKKRQEIFNKYAQYISK